MSKRNISYVKPQDPSFLTKLKAEIGYKEGPNIETKKRKLQEESSDSGEEERPEREDEKPQIVVLQGGDLNAEEVAQEKERIAREAAEAPADLSQRIVFKKRKPKDTETEAATTKHNSTDKCPKNKSKKKNSSQQLSNKLSFNNEDEQEPESGSDQ